ncbi:Pimeloyl-ACP methyl ester carboxylesterase [Streptomyces sp. 2224.1]|uniref:alpha/beta fold hydrolase n=1 Tax=Streptomyces sp. 2224.1 TaxID=1881020 RepID=UPI00089ADEB2|nr:alpha/beta hydrolase [Streptomyces sp. 2224.1]SEB51895.1 Pimeloyl-ACP methyl ester carboxylesterase [Streptomyces sp. 2224.1]
MITLGPALRRASAAGLALAACLAASPVGAVATTPPAADRNRPADHDRAATTAVDVSGPGPVDGSVDGTGTGLDRYYRQHLAWGSCIKGPDDAMGRGLEKAGVRCADVTVPLDYADPRGRTITVAISRLKATDTRHRIGSMLLNNGGPGGPALQSPPDVRKAMKAVGPRYDIIGFDPRFVGRSTPLDCRWPVGTSVLSAGLSRASFERQVTFQKGLADKCRAANASVLPHISTRNTARDMDVIRGALGERKISYLGYSYGTYLGTVYTQLFPGRFDRTVLDGALAPDGYGPRLLQGAEPENERALSDWGAWAARRNAAYGLGRTRADVLATVRSVVAASARGLTVGTAPEVFRLDDTQVPSLITAEIADDSDAQRAALGEHLAVLAKAAGGQPTRLSPQFAAALRTMLNGEDAKSAGAQSAIICGDKPAPRDPERYWRDIERSRAEHALFGPLTNNIGPCAFWDRPREKPTQVRHDAPALIVAATGDPRATYKNSLALHGLLPSSRLITLKGANRHGLYGEYGNACVDGKVNRYLATGKLPEDDQTCVKRDG